MLPPSITVGFQPWERFLKLYALKKSISITKSTEGLLYMAAIYNHDHLFDLTVSKEKRMPAEIFKLISYFIESSVAFVSHFKEIKRSKGEIKKHFNNLDLFFNSTLKLFERLKEYQQEFMSFISWWAKDEVHATRIKRTFPQQMLNLQSIWNTNGIANDRIAVCISFPLIISFISY